MGRRLVSLLHDKIDSLREKQWQELLGLQKEQLTLLATRIERKLDNAEFVRKAPPDVVEAERDKLERYRRGEASEVTAAGCATEACAYAGWHKSPLHAAALRTPGCRAIASAVSGSGTRYWTLVIGQDLKPKSKKKTAWSWSSGRE